MPHDPYLTQEIETALKCANGKWEAHQGEGRATPMILCTEEPGKCHLMYRHNENYQNPGVSSRVHRGG